MQIEVVQEAVDHFHLGGTPVVTHFIAAERETE